MSRIVITLAGLMGVSGVILAAVGAHVAPGTGLDGAAYILLLHAGAVLGATAIAPGTALATFGRRCTRRMGAGVRSVFR